MEKKRPYTALDILMSPFWMACDALEWVLDRCLKGLDFLAEALLGPGSKGGKSDG